MSAVMQPGQPLFRYMKQDDLAEVLAIENAVYDFPWSEGIMSDCIRVGYCCRVQVLADTVVAYSVMSTGAGEAHVLNICVHPEWQRQGIGRAMLEHMLNIARQQEIKIVFLEVRSSNEKAINLYHAAGFNQIGYRKNYYPAHDGREHAVIFAMDLV